MADTGDGENNSAGGPMLGYRPGGTTGEVCRLSQQHLNGDILWSSVVQHDTDGHTYFNAGGIFNPAVGRGPVKNKAKRRKKQQAPGGVDAGASSDEEPSEDEKAASTNALNRHAAANKFHDGGIAGMVFNTAKSGPLHVGCSKVWQLRHCFRSS